ncbi:MAG TPA: hypothetical protein PLU50_00220 [Pseudobdellovibrionaceae bacterium]|nr:hypothetical protein [Pseudobdellovibrionaceae bacterium]
MISGVGDGVSDGVAVGVIVGAGVGVGWFAMGLGRGSTGLFEIGEGAKESARPFPVRSEQPIRHMTSAVAINLVNLLNVPIEQSRFLRKMIELLNILSQIEFLERFNKVI